MKKQRYQFIEDANGLHQLGGEVPDDFKIPENKFLAGFQYLGFINNNDKIFDWLPFKLHLISPIFTDFDFVYLDYKNPNAPEILYPINTTNITSAYNEITTDSIIIYNSANFSLHSFNGITEDNEFDVTAIAGKPDWTQSGSFPICPKTNKKMKFVCQLTSNSPITTKRKNFQGESTYTEKSFNQLQFWEDGDLKVFFEPTSKVACFFIQNT